MAEEPAVVLVVSRRGARSSPTPARLPVPRHRTAADGKVPVLFGCSNLAVTDGEAVALLGTNGAGKSTVLRVVSGLLRKATAFTFDGTDITVLHPARGGLVPGGRGSSVRSPSPTTSVSPSGPNTAYRPYIERTVP